MSICIATFVFVAVSTLAYAREQSVNSAQNVAISGAEEHFNDLVSDKVAQLETDLSRIELLLRHVDASDNSTITDFLTRSNSFESNPALLAVLVVDYEDASPVVSDLALSSGMEAQRAQQLVADSRLPPPETHLSLAMGHSQNEVTIAFVTYRRGSSQSGVTVALLDANTLLAAALTGGHHVESYLTSPDATHTLVGIGMAHDDEQNMAQEMQAAESSSTPPDATGHAHEEDVNHSHEANIFNKTRTAPIFDEDWDLHVRTTEAFLSVPESREGDILVAAGLLLALMSFMASQRIMHARAQDHERVSTAEHSSDVSERRMIHGFEHSPVGVAELGFDGIVRRTNDAMTSFLGLGRGGLDGVALTSCICPKDHRAHQLRIQHLKNVGQGSTKAELKYQHADGKELTVVEHLSVVPGPNPALLLQTEDVTEERRTRDELSQRALRDELTGIPNRALLNDRLAHSLAAAARSKTQLAVMFIDIDNFKVVNDSLGHTVGDDLIRAMATRLEASIRDEDTVARFGGDEFVLVVENVESSLEAEELASRICSTMRDHYTVAGRQLRATVSIGVTVSQSGSNVESLLRNADLALYQAKDHGKNRSKLFDTAMHTAAVERHTLGEELRTALAEGQLVPWYQPIVSATTREVYGVEALVRWNHPTRGTIGPGHFLSIASDTGLVNEIDDLVLRSAAKQMVRWAEVSESARLWNLSVNTTPKHLLEDDYVDGVLTILNEVGLSPQMVIIEVTEDSMLTDFEKAAEVVNSLSSEGVRVAIDDFGTGYSSMSMLATLKIDRLKIDSSFVRSMRHSHESASIVQTCIGLAQNLGISVVAEGVEVAEDLDAVVSAGADLIQGYVYSRPLSGQIIDDILVQHDGRWPQNTRDISRSYKL